MKSVFNLGDIIITFIIIGIIALLTVPPLLSKTNEQDTISAVKNAYTSLGKAYQKADKSKEEYPPEVHHSSKAKEFSTIIEEIFAKQLKIEKNCGKKTGEDCYSTADEGKLKN